MTLFTTRLGRTVSTTAKWIAVTTKAKPTPPAAPKMRQDGPNKKGYFMTTNYNNIIDFSQYQSAASREKEAAKRFPLIYALHTPGGDPLVLFRFISTEEEEHQQVNSYNNNVVRFPGQHQRKI